MQVNSSQHSNPVGQTELVKRPADQLRPPTDGASFDRSEALNRSLSEAPDVRSEVVERARRLIEDTSYPPPEAINKIADLLAMKLSQENPSGEIQ
jgi:hypothetical protein